MSCSKRPRAFKFEKDTRFWRKIYVSKGRANALYYMIKAEKEGDLPVKPRTKTRMEIVLLVICCKRPPKCELDDKVQLERLCYTQLDDKVQLERLCYTQLDD
ncbi:hypothetical protein J6590_051654 [Homalodisca vitripennis]|nr:hypothetical protein J6590_051654 [Homalodisca vitripennis]